MGADQRISSLHYGYCHGTAPAFVGEEHSALLCEGEEDAEEHQEAENEECKNAPSDRSFGLPSHFVT